MGNGAEALLAGDLAKRAVWLAEVGRRVQSPELADLLDRVSALMLDEAEARVVAAPRAQALPL